MDALMGSMMGHGMDSGSNVMFAPENEALARSYWYIVAAVCGVAFFVRVLLFIQARIRHNRVLAGNVLYPTQPTTWYGQVFATSTALYREFVAPTAVFTRKGLQWLSPPTMGQSLLVLIYFSTIAYMLVHNAVVSDAYYWERIGFRAAWVSITQVPLVFLLASKSSIIGFLTGLSHERLNFLHRWISRTLLISVTIHGAFFFREWWLASFIKLELSIMPMVKYGIGAWFLLLWTTLSSLAPLRQLSYELFVIQHMAAAGILLWLLWVHVPTYAQYNVWFAVAAVSFDKVVTWGFTVVQNISVKSQQKLGHKAEIRLIGEGVTEVVVHDVPFSWKAGQHIYLRIPILGPFEAHPFTIANVAAGKSSNKIQLSIKAKSGFTKRLLHAATRGSDAIGGAKTVTALVSGPFGILPAWSSYETLILISASTGSSFILPILDSITTSINKTCVSRIDLLMIVRNRKHVFPHLSRLHTAARDAIGKGIELNISIAITCPCDNEIVEQYMMTQGCATSEGEMAVCKCGNKVPSQILYRVRSDTPVSRPSSSQSDTGNENRMLLAGPTTPPNNNKDNNIDAIRIASSYIPEEKAGTNITELSSSSSSSSSISASSPIFTTPLTTRPRSCNITYTIGTRPNINSFIGPAIEASGGETAVAVCGGRELLAETRNRIAALSDERAVHKGTGAQGIMCWGEGYGY